jgi:hypothetical protein
LRHRVPQTGAAIERIALVNNNNGRDGAQSYDRAFTIHPPPQSTTQPFVAQLSRQAANEPLSRSDMPPGIHVPLCIPSLKLNL